ncbi:MAG: hypothetical protein BWY31_02205 [Lentisphaerae bacterium ADurb.Bin242]|nr:MAG: hypothetical protein BWY31_02205 [Lentisphaerae bacterium ADurb.Bin242]
MNDCFVSFLYFRKDVFMIKSRFRRRIIFGGSFALFCIVFCLWIISIRHEVHRTRILRIHEINDTPVSISVRLEYYMPEKVNPDRISYVCRPVAANPVSSGKDVSLPFAENTRTDKEPWTLFYSRSDHSLYFFRNHAFLGGLFFIPGYYRIASPETKEKLLRILCD